MPSTFEREEIIGYYRAFGEFVDTFAEVEGVLFLYLSTLIGIDQDTAKAVFSGIRAHDSVSFIKRTMEARNVALPTDLDGVLSQLLVINDARNLILHYPVFPRLVDGQIVRTISNFDRALTPERRRDIPISETILMNMRQDLATIGSFLIRECANLIPDEAGDEFGQVPVGAWLYKPAQQSKKATPAPRSRRARRTPPGGSSQR